MYGENIKKIRESKGMSRKELADKLGITEMSVGRYENNQREPKHDVLIKIAEILEVPVTLLILDDNGMDIFNKHINKVADHAVNDIFPLVEYINKDRFQGGFDVKELFSDENIKELLDLAGLIDDIVANRLLHVANKNKNK
mgnify:CR=1 FL=1